MSRFCFLLTFCLLSLVPLVSGHYTWIGWSLGAWTPGSTVELQVGHGDQPPVSEEAASSRGMEAAAIAPSGQKMPLRFFKGTRSLVAKLPVTEPGVWTLYLSQDFGTRIRKGTSSAPARGDRTVRSYRSATAYAGGGEWPGKPVGLPFELTGSKDGPSIYLMLRKDGKPAKGVNIAVFHGERKVSVGATGDDGRLTWRVPPGSSGQVVFTVDWVEQPSSGQRKYDQAFWSTSLTASL